MKLDAACTYKLKMTSKQDCLCSECLNTRRLDRIEKTIPEYIPTFKEISTQMRINIDFLKKEISDHCDSEIQRFKNQIEALK